MSIRGFRVNDLVLHTARLEDGTYVDVKLAWSLVGEILDVPLKEFEDVLYDRAWEGRAPVDCAHMDPHWTLVLEADLEFPIIAIRESEGFRSEGFWIVDGRHRVVKAWLLGHDTIRVRVVDREALATLAVDSDKGWYVLNGTA
jgi:hypothetical protein